MKVTYRHTITIVQVLAIEFVPLANELVPLANEFVLLANELVIVIVIKALKCMAGYNYSRKVNSITV